MLGRLAVRYPELPIIFAGSRKFAEECLPVPRCRGRRFGPDVGDISEQ
jgi:hypothetical protein